MILAHHNNNDNYHDDENNAEDNNHEINTNNNDFVSSEKRTNNDNNKKEDPSMEQCIALLEPHLAVFRSRCDSQLKQKKKLQKEKKLSDKKQKSKQNSERNFHNDKNNDKNNKQPEDESPDDNADDADANDDEVPPQLIRIARFFAWRWLPIKRALLRPPPSSQWLQNNQLHHKNSTNLNNNTTNAKLEGNTLEGDINVELGMAYRLRLAKAAHNKGLIGGAEYELLLGAFENHEKEERKLKSCKAAHDDNDDYCKRFKSGKNDLMDRTRLALMRLPTDAIRPNSVSGWKHVKEMIGECCHYWKDAQETKQILEPAPAQVADWAMTSWTAILLSQGLDPSLLSRAKKHHYTTTHSIIKIEESFALLLSDRSSSSPALPLAYAISDRINELLSPPTLESLNGILLFSLGRLFQQFASREDAENHIIRSIVQCAIVGGAVGLAQLSRLVAVYCCGIATLPSTAECNTDMDITSLKNRCKTQAFDLETRLRAKLDSVERIRNVLAKDDSNPHLDNTEFLFQAKSFLDVILHAAAHLVRCGTVGLIKFDM